MQIVDVSKKMIYYLIFHLTGNKIHFSTQVFRVLKQY